SALLFPLSLIQNESQASIVRTILSIDEEKGSMTFAGDIPEGSYVRLMKANFEKLIDGACSAAEMSKISLKNNAPDLALLISCVGRKIVMKQRVEEELYQVRDVLGESTVTTGFYSYGEIGPVEPSDKHCELHNQTMTITVFKEV
ncbi:MAG: FIST C-terminal domain-containing protein, partial [Mariniphaga sp.]